MKTCVLLIIINNDKNPQIKSHCYKKKKSLLFRDSLGLIKPFEMLGKTTNPNVTNTHEADVSKWLIKKQSCPKSAQKQWKRRRI